MSISIALPAPVRLAAPERLIALARRRRRGLAIGIGAALAAAAIWGAALAMTRLGVSGSGTLAPLDIAALRFLGPTLALLPVLLRALPKLRRIDPLLLLGLFVGGGTPFVLVVSSGLQTAGAAEAGALLPGTVPLSVAVLSALLGERFGRARLVGLGLIALAVAVLVGPAIIGAAGVSWLGYALLLAASALCAIYIHALRRAGLGPLEVVAFVSTASAVSLAPVYLAGLGEGLFAAPWQAIVVHGLYQSVASGLIAPAAFAIAVARLGGPQAAAFGSLSPAAATLTGVVLLGEVPDAAALVAVVASGLGVALVNLGVGRPQPGASQR
ncbi:EamA family transporter [Elioraea sp.]|uniref:EamA family transporter n=1 Tax=Elioraea sp. TaxID=2185103 RepID=UPI003F72A4B1